MVHHTEPTAANPTQSQTLIPLPSLWVCPESRQQSSLRLLPSTRQTIEHVDLIRDRRDILLSHTRSDGRCIPRCGR